MPVLEERLASSHTLPVRHVAAHVDRQPVQPRGELRLAAKLADAGAQLGERLLRRIAGVLRIAEEVERKLLDARRVPLAERLERLRITVFCAFDQDRIAQPGVDEWPFRAEGLL